MNKAEFRNQLIHFLDFEPTTDQETFIQRASNFICEPKLKDLFILRGYAGTGKTSLIAALVKTLNSFQRKTVLMAPTGRAAKVMSTYANQIAYTIHKRIYWLQEEGGEVSFRLGRNNLSNTLFIVDEASMISGFTPGSYNNLLEDLIQFVYNGKNCKLMLVGDIAQLPPVGSDISPALVPKYFRDEFHIRIDGVELKEVVRQQEDSGILFNATEIRNKIETEDFKLSVSTASHIDMKSITGADLEEELQTAYSEKDERGVIIITRSNKRANLFNQQIRQRILFRESELAAGDLLMIVKNNYHWLDNDSKIGFIANGDTFQVNRVLKTQEMHGFRFATVSGFLIDYPDEPELEVNVILDSIDVESPSLPKNETDKLFWSVYQDYPEAKTKTERMEKVKKDPFYNALQIKFSYAITCHKAQGGQWPIVFIDQGYLTEDMLNKELMRWMYTAFTRATEKLFLVNFSDNFIAD